MVTADSDLPAELSKLQHGYELLGELSRDELVTIYLARDRLSGKEVAIKVLRAPNAQGREALAHYASDARLLTALDHPNIVAVHSVKWLSEDVVAVVTERVRGPSLRQVLDVAGTLPVSRATEVLRGLGRALAWAHSSQIMHRDLRPENVIFEDRTGRVVLSDFGLARRIETAPAPSDTAPDAYRAPELADGRYPDRRSDVFSLGIVGWELLTGRRPYPDDMEAIPPGERAPQPPPLAEVRPGLPAALVAALEGAVQLDRDRRIADVVTFMERLTKVAPPAPEAPEADEETHALEPTEWIALPVPRFPSRPRSPAVDREVPRDVAADVPADLPAAEAAPMTPKAAEDPRQADVGFDATVVPPQQVDPEIGIPRGRESERRVTREPRRQVERDVSREVPSDVSRDVPSDVQRDVRLDERGDLPRETPSKSSRPNGPPATEARGAANAADLAVTAPISSGSVPPLLPIEDKKRRPKKGGPVPTTDPWSKDVRAREDGRGKPEAPVAAPRADAPITSAPSGDARPADAPLADARLADVRFADVPLAESRRDESTARHRPLTEEPASERLSAPLSDVELPPPEPVPFADTRSEPLSGPISGPVRGRARPPETPERFEPAMRGGLGTPRPPKSKAKERERSSGAVPPLQPMWDTPVEFPLPVMPDPRPMPADGGGVAAPARRRWTRRGIGIAAVVALAAIGALTLARMERAPDTTSRLMQPETPTGYGGDVALEPRSRDTTRVGPSSVREGGAQPPRGATAGGASRTEPRSSTAPSPTTASPTTKSPTAAPPTIAAPGTASSRPRSPGAARAPGATPSAAAPRAGQPREPATQPVTSAPSTRASNTPPRTPPVPANRSGTTTATAPRTGDPTRAAAADPVRTSVERPSGVCGSPALADQRACLAAHIDRSDAGLNQIYGDVIVAMRERANSVQGDPDPPEVQRLRNTQRSWLARRDAECRRRGRGREGPLWATPRAQCLQEFSAERERQLSATLARLRRD